MDRTLFKRVIGSLLNLLPLLLAAWMLFPGSLGTLFAFTLLWIPMEYAGLRLVGPALVILQELERYDFAYAASAAAGLAVGAMARIFLQRKNKTPLQLTQKSPWPALYPVLSITCAVVMTLYQCSGYFAVGAQGAGLVALLRSYRSLGFHPNWRTVLFSTIMMVILITWPRKFKSLSKVLPGSAVGLVAVTLLNLVLNPDPLRSAVTEFPTALPILSRMPISALSMLLIFAAWEEVPFGRVKEIMQRRRPLELLMLAGGPILLLLVFA